MSNPQQQQQYLNLLINGTTINSNEYSDLNAIADALPSISATNDLLLTISISNHDAIQKLIRQKNPISLSISHQVHTSTDEAKQNHKDMQRVLQKIHTFQQSLQTASHIVQAVMRKVKSIFLFAGFESDIIAHIFSYCSSIPLRQLMLYGYSRYSQQIQKNFDSTRKQNSSNVGQNNQEKQRDQFDMYQNINIVNFSLVCKPFANALQKNVPLVIVRTTKDIPSTSTIEQYTSLDNLFVQLSDPIKNEFIKLSTDIKNQPLFAAKRLTVDCKQLPKQTEQMVSLFRPKVLVLANLKLFPRMINSVMHLIIEYPGSEDVEVTAAEHMLEVLKNSSALKRVTLRCKFATQSFLEEIAKLQHLQVALTVQQALMRDNYEIAFPSHFTVSIRCVNTSNPNYSDFVQMENEQKQLKEKKAETRQKKRKTQKAPTVKRQRVKREDEDAIDHGQDEAPSAKRQRVKREDEDDIDMGDIL